MAQAGPGVGQERRPLPAGAVARQGRQEPEHGRRDEEGGRVHQQDPADVQDRQRQGRDQRAEGLAAVGGDADGGVGPVQVGLGHDRRDGGPRRRLEDLAGDGPQPDQDKQQRQRRQPEGDDRDQGGLDQLAGDHDPPPVQPVGHRPGQGAQQRRGEIAGQQQHRHRQGLPGRLGHVQHEGDQAERVAKERHRPGGPQQAERPVHAQQPQRPRPGWSPVGGHGRDPP
jgi:hypothetical protein